MILPEDHKDFLSELINIGVGRGAQALNLMLDNHISLAVPRIEVLDTGASKVKELYESCQRQAAVSMEFSGGFMGSSLLAFDPESAVILVDAILGNDELTEELNDEIDALRASTLVEVGNIVINGVLGSISNGLGVHVDYTVPVYDEVALASLFKESSSQNAQVQIIILANTIFKSESLDLTGELILLFELSTIRDFVLLLESKLTEENGAYI